MGKMIGSLMIVIGAVFLVSAAEASNVGFDVGINVGNAPVAVAPVYASPPPIIEEPPEFVARPSMGFYAAVGTPYDLFYAGNRYYLCRGNAWYAAPYYNGPWAQVRYRELPWGLRRYPIARMRYLRDEGRRHYDDDGYYQRRFRPEWQDWRRHERWEREKPCQVSRYRRDRDREDDDRD